MIERKTSFYCSTSLLFLSLRCHYIPTPLSPYWPYFPTVKLRTILTVPTVAPTTVPIVPPTVSLLWPYVPFPCVYVQQSPPISLRPYVYCPSKLITSLLWPYVCCSYFPTLITSQPYSDNIPSLFQVFCLRWLGSTVMNIRFKHFVHCNGTKTHELSLRP